MKSINLAEKLSLFSEHFKPRTVGQFNGHDLMVAKAEGSFVWHKHEETDDFFLVLKGRLTIQIAHPRSGRTRLRGHQGRVQVHQGAVPRPGQERHAGVRGLCVGQLVYGARPFAAHSMGVVRPK
jgi:hypothetical protein